MLLFEVKNVVIMIFVASATTYSVLKDLFWDSASGQFTSGSILSVKKQLLSF